MQSLHKGVSRIGFRIKLTHLLEPSAATTTNQRLKSSKTLMHNERKLVNVSPQVMYETVKNVDNYKNFVPYCFESNVVSKTENTSNAKLSVGFGPVTEHYTSKLKFEDVDFVEALCSDGKLFNSLNCMWKFKPVRSPEMCVIDFHVDFEFKSQFHSSLANLFFNEVVKKMVGAFEQEAKRQSAAAEIKPALTKA